MIVIVRLEFELAYNGIAVRYVSHYPTVTSSRRRSVFSSNFAIFILFISFNFKIRTKIKRLRDTRVFIVKQTLISLSSQQGQPTKRFLFRMGSVCLPTLQGAWYLTTTKKSSLTFRHTLYHISQLNNKKINKYKKKEKKKQRKKRKRKKICRQKSTNIFSSPTGRWKFSLFFYFFISIFSLFLFFLNFYFYFFYRLECIHY